MNTAFRMLFAPITRDMTSRRERCCTSAYSGTMNRPPNTPIRPRSMQHAPRARLRDELRGASSAMPGGIVRRREVQVDRERGEADRAERHQADLDFVSGQAFAQQRADADAGGEHHEHQRDDLFAAAEHILRVQRQLREHERAVEPEPRDAEDRQEHGARFARGADVVPRRRPRAPIDAQVGRRGVQLRDREADREARRPRSPISVAVIAPMLPVGRQQAGQRACRAGSRGTCPSRSARCRRPAPCRAALPATARTSRARRTSSARPS